MTRIPIVTPRATPARNCHMATASAAQDGCQSLDIAGRHIGEPKTGFTPRRRSAVKLREPDDLGPAAQDAPVGQQHFELQLVAGPELLVSEHPHSAKADVLCVPFVMEEADARGPTEDIRINAWIPPAVGHGGPSISSGGGRF